MKKQILTLFVLGLVTCFFQTESSNIFTSKAKTLSLKVVQGPTDYTNGYNDGTYDKANGLPYKTTFNPPSDRDAAKDYQTGYLAGFAN